MYNKSAWEIELMEEEHGSSKLFDTCLTCNDKLQINNSYGYYSLFLKVSFD